MRLFISSIRRASQGSVQALLVLQGVRHFITTFLSNEVWTLVGTQAYPNHRLADVGTAQLRPFKPLGPEAAGMRPPRFHPTCRYFDGKIAARCASGAACPYSHARLRMWA
jgi:hypothetical protein